MTFTNIDTVPVARIQRLVTGSHPTASPNPDPALPLRALHLNESPFPPAPKVIAAMQEAAAGLNRYPDHDGAKLVAALAERTGVSPERLLIGAGSNEIVYASADIALDQKDEGAAPVPGFPTYAKVIGMRGATYVGVPVREDGIIDVDATLAAVTPRTRLVYVTSPQNPTGGLIEPEGVERLARELPEHLLLHFDEAYYEFGRHAGGVAVLPILEQRKGPWTLTRSFSKAFGLAGARVGYGVTSSKALADAYRKIRTTFSVTPVAQAGACAALNEEAYVASLLDHTRTQRERIAGGLAQLGFRPFPSAANFLSAVAPKPATELAAALKARNILVISFPWRDSPGALRVTIGTADDTDALLGALTDILATA
jgi:histidinol-phosphate aminotransferase